MINRFYLRAKYTRKSRQRPAVPPKTALIPRADDVPMTLQSYFLAQLHIARCWGGSLPDEYSWFISALRGELPPKVDHSRDFYVHFVFLPRDQYFRALEAITTRLGVKLPT